MPKWDKTRDYYSDLEVSANASAEEIKKQFRKLALKYHPDRNPGREAEVNSKFQVIQSAQEILTDDTLRRQYDEARKIYSSRFPKASGVRGNPWQDFGKEYQPPPTRQPAQTASNRPHSGAQRYASFTNNIPRASKPTPRDDPQARKSYADAWDNMRSSSTRRAPPQAPGRAPTSAARDTKSSDSEAVPPRTAYQQQKAEASFGSRRTGFVPRSPGVADEPPVTSKNYFTTRTHSNIFNDPSPDPTQPAPTSHPTTSIPKDPLSQFRENFGDSRHSTPYHTPGGEKTSLFDDGPGVDRSTSTRSPRRPNMPGAFPASRQRSSSTPRSSSNDGGSEDSTKPGGRRTPNNSTAFQTRLGDRQKTKPGVNGSTAQPARPATAGNPSTTTTASTDGAKFSTAAGGSSEANKGPSLYAPPSTNPSTSAHPKSQATRPEAGRAPSFASRQPGWLPHFSDYKPDDPSSGGVKHKPSLSLFEKMQRNDLDWLIDGKKVDKSAFEATDGAAHVPISSAKRTKTEYRTNDAPHSSFNIPVGSNISNGGTDMDGLSGHSADNINTKFVEDEHPDDWKFSAGTTSAGEPVTPTKARAPSRNRINRRQTAKPRPAQPERMPSMQENFANATQQGFSAGEWSDKIGSQHFEPQPPRSTSNSPTRRANAKKSRPVKMTAGSAGLVDDELNEGRPEKTPPPSGTVPTSADSSTAMDIDTPPSQKVDGTPKASHANDARKIPVEPHREEWRAGDVNGVHPKPPSPTRDGNPTQDHAAAASIPAPTPFVAQHGGSEDSEDFRTTFSDFNNVAPFAASAPTGLKDLGDLKSTLPFPSRPSEQIPLEREQLPKFVPLSFPTPPVAPRLPQTSVGYRSNHANFRKYAQDFYQYMEKWENFNTKIMRHFSTRQEHFVLRRQQRGSAWLDATAQGDGAKEYLQELEQDQAVRTQWANAFADHQAKLREFMTFRDEVR
ncbi:hypothetical protein GGS23DRAFT_609241 [Durotheca rogersii]|uniref:uncharacterized protein n=1 Tax=Durotheca rogersii TaxID=419775 RepID=UPI00221F2EFF|nr:uncharacterized protein GGS23DRAFT_609241 [Durotheca rogersii]KAI5868557.1 hypothetical protein GGS23DRAFT_609241 [Durotheca rogersii]